MGPGMGLALSRGPSSALNGGVAANLLMNLDFEDGRFWFEGRAYPDIGALLAAAGGTSGGAGLVFGPVLADAGECITNGDFASGDLDGWTPITSEGGSVSVVAGAARLSSTGSAAGVTQPLALVPDRAYCARYTVGGGTTNFRIGGAGPTLAGPAGGTRTVGAYTDTFSADEDEGHFYAFRAGNGTVSVDDISVRPCAPLAGFDPLGVTVEIAARAPEDFSATQALWSCGQVMTADAGDEISIFTDTSAHLRVTSTLGDSPTADFDLGVLSAGQDFVVRAGFGANGFFAQRDNGPLAIQHSGRLAGLAVMRVGSDFSGSDWGGEIARVSVVADSGEAAFFKLARGVLRCEGDSFMTPIAGVSLPQTLQTLLGRGVFSTASGGSTIAEISQRVVSQSHLLAHATLFWDGSETPVAVLADVAPYLDTFASAIAALGHHRFVLVPPCANFDAVDLSVLDAIRDGMAARWPGHVLDWRDHLALDGAGAPSAAMFHDPIADQTHLSQAAIDLMAEAIASHLAARGW